MYQVNICYPWEAADNAETTLVQTKTQAYDLIAKREKREREEQGGTCELESWVVDLDAVPSVENDDTFETSYLAMEG